jgi:hypothetical protein
VPQLRRETAYLPRLRPHDTPCAHSPATLRKFRDRRSGPESVPRQTSSQRVLTSPRLDVRGPNPSKRYLMTNLNAFLSPGGSVRTCSCSVLLYPAAQQVHNGLPQSREPNVFGDALRADPTLRVRSSGLHPGELSGPGPQCLRPTNAYPQLSSATRGGMSSACGQLRRAVRSSARRASWLGEARAARCRAASSVCCFPGLVTRFVIWLAHTSTACRTACLTASNPIP